MIGKGLETWVRTKAPGSTISCPYCEMDFPYWHSKTSNGCGEPGNQSPLISLALN